MLLRTIQSETGGHPTTRSVVLVLQLMQFRSGCGVMRWHGPVAGRGVMHHRAVVVVPTVCAPAPSTVAVVWTAATAAAATMTPSVRTGWKRVDVACPASRKSATAGRLARRRSDGGAAAARYGDRHVVACEVSRAAAIGGRRVQYLSRGTRGRERVYNV